MFKQKKGKTKDKREVTTDLKFIRTSMIVPGGDIVISYLSKEDNEIKMGSDATKLYWIAKQFVEYYRIHDLTIINKIRQSFFKYFPDKKNSCLGDYAIGLSTCIASDDNFEKVLMAFDTKARSFLNEARSRCRNQRQDRKSPWLVDCEV